MAVIDAVSTVTTSSSALTVANNLRIASIAVAAYEYVAGSFLLSRVVTCPSASCLITIPSELRLYKTSSRRR